MNKSYRRGYAFENSLKKKLEAKGFYVIRSAGSKGVFDLIAVRNGKVYGIQCKTGDYIHERELLQITDTAKRFFQSHLGLISTRSYKLPVLNIFFPFNPILV